MQQEMHQRGLLEEGLREETQRYKHRMEQALA